MAKQVLTFNNADYTCPVGKTAKVVVESFTAGGVFMGTVGYTYHNANADIEEGFQSAIGNSNYTVRSISAGIGGSRVDSNGMDMYGTPREVFLAAGDTYGGSGIGAKYAVFEEDL